MRHEFDVRLCQVRVIEHFTISKTDSVDLRSKEMKQHVNDDPMIIRFPDVTQNECDQKPNYIDDEGPKHEIIILPFIRPTAPSSEPPYPPAA